MTDLELHDWALLRYRDEDLANKLAIVEQLFRDDQLDEPGPVLYLPGFPSDRPTDPLP